MKRHAILVLLVSIGLAAAIPARAQEGGQATCPQFVRQAYADLSTACLYLDSNMACYGFKQVDGLLIAGQTVPEHFFEEPGYRTDLTTLARVTGSPFDLTTETWGLAKLAVRVYTDDLVQDDPQTVEDNLRDVQFLLIGDVELENAVEPQFDAEGHLLIDADHPGPMQVSFLRSGYDTPGCPDAPPPLLLVQGAQDADTTITVNGARMQLNAGDPDQPLPTLLVLQILPPGTSMRLLVLAGLVTLDPDGTPLILPPGYWTTVCLGAPEDRGLDGQANDQWPGCPWAEPARIDQGLIDRLTGLAGLPENVLGEPVGVPVLLHASGAGTATGQLVFADPNVLRLARAACDAGTLAPDICAQLFP